jgi:uncharacterized protein (DUF433 family)
MRESTTTKTSVIHTDPEIQSGTPVFVGTRVPAASLFDWLEGGSTLEEFLDNFPSVTRDQAIAALEEAKARLVGSARPAR